jgi:hypothetical protein
MGSPISPLALPELGGKANTTFLQMARVPPAPLTVALTTFNNSILGLPGSLQGYCLHAPALPPDETDRLRRLRELAQLDLPPDDRHDLGPVFPDAAFGKAQALLHLLPFRGQDRLAVQVREPRPRLHQFCQRCESEDALVVEHAVRKAEPVSRGVRSRHADAGLELLDVELEKSLVRRRQHAQV